MPDRSGYGTSKCNKIEHRMFCHITQNWRGQPLESRATVIELIANTTTKTGLKVECALDERTYEKGIRISNDQMRQSKAIIAVIVEGLLTSKTGSS